MSLKYSERIIQAFAEEYGIDVREVIEKGILHPTDARNWLVKALYFKMAKADPERTYIDIKYELSVVYDLSVSMIEKLIYRK